MSAQGETETVVEAWPIREHHYYGGTLTLELRCMPAYPGVAPYAVLVWHAYDGGSAELRLQREGVNDDELTTLRDALTLLLAAQDRYTAEIRAGLGPE